MTRTVLSARLGELDAAMEAPGFWDDQRAAARVSAERSRAQRKLETFAQLEDEAGELDTMLEMAADEQEWRDELEASLDRLGREIARLQEQALFTGEYDAGPAVVTVHAGAGGTDARTGRRCCCACTCAGPRRRGFKVDLLEQTPGEEAGIKSATFALNGRVRLRLHAGREGRAPAGAACRRSTRAPPPHLLRPVDVSPAGRGRRRHRDRRGDLRIDTYRSQGAGGQHVNKTDSAVRLTHLPTGIVVQCQNERCQLQNKAQAMQILKSRLIEREEERRRQALAKERGEAQDISFGNQIRSYVLHPYTMVKDHRTNHEIGNAQGVLDGDLDGFIHAYLLSARAAAS